MHRLEREKKTIRVMIRLFCTRMHHRENDLCAACSPLLDYALSRADKCRYIINKPTCKECPVHCYNPEMRERIRKVMRYAGPRLLFSHPVLTILHLIDSIGTPAIKNRQDG